MAAPLLELPTLQNWSCHNCGGCCRQHAIEVTDEERQRILDQKWTAADGVPADRPLFVPYGGPFWKRRYRLAHQPDGACVFLDEKGLCRIHAKFGELAKPLPCRIYPYAFHPAGRKFGVSLRYSCPSVVANKGKSVAAQQKSLREMAAAVVPPGAERIRPPEVSPGVRADWPDLMRLVETLDRLIAGPEGTIGVRLLRALYWLDLAGVARFDKLKGERLGEFLALVEQAAVDESPRDLAAVPEPTPTARMQFRLLVAQCARKDTFADASAGLRGHWRLFRAATRFARGNGLVPSLQPELKEVPFAALEQPFGPLPPLADERLTRYLRVKVQGMHFCGLGHFGWPLADGFRSLALMVPVVLWIARWLAAGDGRTVLDLSDVERAMAIADHHFGYSPALGQPAARRRVRLLTRNGDISRLCAWYSR